MPAAAFKFAHAVDHEVWCRVADGVDDLRRRFREEAAL